MTSWFGIVGLVGMVGTGCSSTINVPTGDGGTTPATAAGDSGTGVAMGAEVSCNDLCGKATAAKCTDATDCPAACAQFSAACKACVAKAANICSPDSCTATCSGPAVGGDCTAGAEACMFNSDCSNNGSCNSSTKRCFAKTATCIGTACSFNSDCPDTEKCNSAEMKCVTK